MKRLNKRIIGRLDIKGPNLIKGIRLEGLRVIGDPSKFAQRYYESGIDELIYMDIVASLYNRNSLTDIVEYTANNIFIPMTVGGGIRTVEDATKILRAGADKVAINTAAIARSELVSDLADRFGSQCVVVSIEAKHNGSFWEAYTDNGREKTGLEVIEWAKQVETLGAGEILLTSVDNEGLRKGFANELIAEVSSELKIPIIASGGFGKVEHLKECFDEGKADAIAIADGFHYGRFSVPEIKTAAKFFGIQVRE